MNTFRVRILFENCDKTSFCVSGKSADEVKARVMSGLVPSLIRDNVKRVEVKLV